MAGTSAISKSLLIIFVIAVGMANIAKSAPCSSQSPTASYELIYRADATTAKTGAVFLECRNDATAEALNINTISFYLNRTSANDLPLRERGDVTVTAEGSTGIKFNLTRRLEGSYTCGTRVNCNSVIESPPKTLISLQTIVPLLPLPQTNFAVAQGERAILQCPIQPGALLQQYSVSWYKEGIEIARALNPQTVTTTDSRYKIDRDTYSLIIDSANTNDTSSNYQCELFVANPNTDSRVMLQPSPSVTLSLEVNGYPVTTDEEPMVPVDSTTESQPPTPKEVTDDPLVNLWCKCQPKNPSLE